MKKPIAPPVYIAEKRRLEKIMNELSPFEAGWFESFSNQYSELLNRFQFFPYQYKARGKFGIKALSGEIILPAKFDQLRFFERVVKKGSGIAAQKDNKWGIVLADGKGTQITDFLFDDMDALHFITRVRLADKYGLIKKNGRLLLPIQYDEIEEGFISGTYSFRLGDKYGVTNSKIITPPIFDEINYELLDEWNCVVVRFGDKEGYIDHKGAFTEDFNLCLMKEKF